MNKVDAPSIFVIIPAFNEQNAVCNVLSEIPKDLVSEVIVVNNGSTDNTVSKPCPVALPFWMNQTWVMVLHVSRGLNI